MVGSAFFSAAETSLTGISEAVVFSKAKKGNKAALLVRELLKNKSNLIIVLLTLNNFFNIFFSAILTSLGITYWGNDYVIVFALINTIIILVIGEILPKTYALAKPDKVAFLVAPIIYIFVKIITPCIKILVMLNDSWLKKLTKNQKHENYHSSLDNIRGAIDLMSRYDSSSKNTDYEKSMLNSVLDLYDINISEIMFHRKNVFCLDIETEPKELLEAIMKSSYVTIPIYQGSKDNIIGMLESRECLKSYYLHGLNFKLKDIIKTPVYFPETTSAFDLLNFLQKRKDILVVVIDEYGGFMGVISIFDILEEIVGELSSVQKWQNIEKLKNVYIVSGDITIRDFNRRLKSNLPDEYATTVAGLILYETGVIPNTGSVFSLYGFKFEILEKKYQQITKIKIIKE